MMLQNNWGLKLTLTVEADETDDMVAVLRQAIKQIKRGDNNGQDNFCAGDYQYKIVEPRRPRQKRGSL